MSFEEYENAVVELVATRLEEEEWYVGVITSTISNSFRDNLSVEDAAMIAEMETAYQDGPKSDQGW